MVRKFQLEHYKEGGNSGPGSCVLQEHSLKPLGIQGIIVVPYFRPFQSQEKSPSKFYELVVFQQTYIRAFFFLVHVLEVFKSYHFADQFNSVLSVALLFQV